MKSYPCSQVAKTFKENLNQGAPAPYWLVTGSEGFLMVETGDALRKMLREAGFNDRQVMEMNGRSDWTTLTMAAADIGMFSDNKIIEVHVPNGKPGKSAEAVFEKLFERPYDGVSIVFYFPQPDWRDAKAAWWQNLVKNCVTLECNGVDRKHLPQWLNERLGRNGQSATPEALEYFTDLVEGNLFAAAQEVEKLALIAPKGELSRDDIYKAVVSSSRFDLTSLFECMELGQPDRVLRVIDGLAAQDEALPLILSMLSNEIRSMIKLRTAFDQGKSYTQGVFATPAMKQACRRLTLNKLKNALIVCAEIDKLSKGLTVPTRDSDPWIELKSVVLFLAK